MTVTRCITLPDLRDPEEMAMFTFARLLNLSQLQTTSVGELLTGIHEYILNTWGVSIDPDEMDLRWSDATGDIFTLRNPHTISRLLQEQRPNWAQAQEVGVFGSPLPFNSPTQPYIMRMSCHKALPPNYLPWTVLSEKRTCCAAAKLSSQFTCKLVFRFSSPLLLGTSRLFLPINSSSVSQHFQLSKWPNVTQRRPTNVLARRANAEDFSADFSQDESDQTIPWAHWFQSRVQQQFAVLSLAFSSIDPIPADRNPHVHLPCFFQKSPAAAGRVCVWTIWRDVKLLTLV